MEIKSMLIVCRCTHRAMDHDNYVWEGTKVTMGACVVDECLCKGFKRVEA